MTKIEGKDATVTIDGQVLTDIEQIEITADARTVPDAQRRGLVRIAAKDIPRAVLARAAAAKDDEDGEPVAPEADPVAVQLAAREIYAQLPHYVLNQLRALARTYGNNRHARRATAAILRRYFNGKAADAQRYAAKRANEKEAKKTPTQKRDERNPCPLF